MAQNCLQNCPMTKCARFFSCPEHWDTDELAEMAPPVPPPDTPRPRPDWVEPEFEEDNKK